MDEKTDASSSSCRNGRFGSWRRQLLAWPQRGRRAGRFRVDTPRQGKDIGRVDAGVAGDQPAPAFFRQQGVETTAPGASCRHRRSRPRCMATQQTGHRYRCAMTGRTQAPTDCPARSAQRRSSSRISRLRAASALATGSLSTGLAPARACPAEGLRHAPLHPGHRSRPLILRLPHRPSDTR